MMEGADHHIDKTDKISHNSELSDDSGIDCTYIKAALEENEPKLATQMPYDVFFFVGDSEKIGAHKDILMTVSEVFLNLFSKTDKQTYTFHIPDICGDEFKELLRHIYCGDEHLNLSNIIAIMCAAEHFKLLDLKQSCLTYLHNCLEVDNACSFLLKARFYVYSATEKLILSFIGKHYSDVLQTEGMKHLTRTLLNEVLTLPGADEVKFLKRTVADRWARNQCKEKQQAANNENIMNSLQDCFYVNRDNSTSQRYVLDSVTSRNIFETHEKPVLVLTQSSTELKTDDLVTSSSRITLKASFVDTLMQLSSTNLWPYLDRVTRLHQVHSSDINDAFHADAISFTVSHNIYLYGISIYGPRKQEEGSYKIDTILYQKKKVIIMETVCLTGAGLILPAMLERPVKVDKNCLYTLETYIKGPESYIGTGGLTKMQSGPVLFTFSNTTEMKRNRTDTSKGQIPRLYFMLRQFTH